MGFTYLAPTLFIAMMLGSCASSNFSSTQDSLSRAANAQWAEQVIPANQASDFDLFSLRNSTKPIDGVLTIYIEGDGHAWDGQFPSGDPTPRQTIGLDLALNQPKGAIAYLGRPCQFKGIKDNIQCNSKIWTDERFSNKVVRSINHGVDVLKQSSGAKGIVLIGFSGGGALAVLVAARRDDVIQIITVAGNLDIDGWTKYHHVQPLVGSLNPLDSLAKIQKVPQIHFVGDQDHVVPAFLTQNLGKYYSADMKAKIITIKNNGHICCWADQWANLWKQTYLH